MYELQHDSIQPLVTQTCKNNPKWLFLAPKPKMANIKMVFGGPLNMVQSIIFLYICKSHGIGRHIRYLLQGSENIGGDLHTLEDDCSYINVFKAARF